MRVSGKFALTVLALLVACLALVPAASATSFTLFVGTTAVATETLSTCGSNVCVSITGEGGNEVRIGGPTFGFSGATSITSLIAQSFTVDKTHKLTGPSGVCGGMKAESICFQTTGSQTASTVTFQLTGVTLSEITDAGLHVVGPACGMNSDGSFKTCFAGSTPGTTTPEPGSLGLMGTGLLGLAGLVRKRLSKV